MRTGTCSPVCPRPMDGGDPAKCDVTFYVCSRRQACGSQGAALQGKTLCMPVDGISAFAQGQDYSRSFNHFCHARGLCNRKYALVSDFAQWSRAQVWRGFLVTTKLLKATNRVFAAGYANTTNNSCRAARSKPNRILAGLSVFVRATRIDPGRCAGQLRHWPVQTFISKWRAVRYDLKHA